MSSNKKTDMFAKLAAQQARPVQDEPVEASDPVTNGAPPLPCPAADCPVKVRCQQTKGGKAEGQTG
jgi:hypothetical protein